MIRTSDTLKEISAAWVAAAAEMPHVPKETEGQVGNVKRKYADLATVTETIRPILAAHSLAYVQGCSGDGATVTVTTRLIHSSGEWMEDSLTLISGNTAQLAGSAITYCRRYSLMAILGLAPDDDDGAAASKAPAAPKARAERVRSTGEYLASRLRDPMSEATRRKLMQMKDEAGRKLTAPDMDANPEWAKVVLEVLDGKKIESEPQGESL